MVLIKKKRNEKEKANSKDKIKGKWTLRVKDSLGFLHSSLTHQQGSEPMLMTLGSS